ncbi:hypothetical protein [Dongia deserti]|uniref:hypothetical protein n=1 Tax=Dongia deserti TaxID=2268030 RepID=UPI0013C50C7E|nr:hypothetical protein [Dongia deserti]
MGLMQREGGPPMAPLRGRTRARAGPRILSEFELEIRQLYLQMMDEPVPPRLLDILRTGLPRSLDPPATLTDGTRASASVFASYTRDQEIIMAEQKMPGQAGGQQRERKSTSRRSQQDPQREHESASPQQQSQEPKERASDPDMGERDAARRQSRQDPLQTRDR